MPYRYFVSYAHGVRGSWGFGCSEITAQVPIQGMQDVTNIAGILEREIDRENVTILGWQRFEDA